MRDAKSAIIVPPYGMAVAQAQHTVNELTRLLREKGVDVRFAIHQRPPARAAATHDIGDAYFTRCTSEDRRYIEAASEVATHRTCLGSARRDHVYTDASLLQLTRPASRERAHCCLARVVKRLARKAFAASNRAVKETTPLRFDDLGFSLETRSSARAGRSRNWGRAGTAHTNAATTTRGAANWQARASVLR
jgi:hypothetical protein